MRISDWSSDVCSSDLKADLQRGEGRTPRRDARIMRGIDLVEIGLVGEILDVDAERDRLVDLVRGAGVEADIAGHRSDQRLGRRADRHVAVGLLDRKSVVWGMSVSVRVDLGGRRILKKKNNT